MGAVEPNPDFGAESETPSASEAVADGQTRAFSPFALIESGKPAASQCHPKVLDGLFPPVFRRWLVILIPDRVEFAEENRFNRQDVVGDHYLPRT